MTGRSAIVALAVLAALSAGCGGASRFALRPPVWRDPDDRPFLPVPAFDEEMDVANTVDAIVLHPISHGLLFEPTLEAHDVNSLDEVPDSSWFTNRSPSPEEAAVGACDGAEPVPPFTVVSSKLGGTTPGLVIEDATEQRYVLKLDGGGREANSAADAIVSRLYWAVGFHVPCNRVVYVDQADFVLTDRSYERRPTGTRRPLTSERLAELFEGATRGADGLVRVGASRYIDGEPIGTWRAEGTRADDPNDVIPHENRRELRGERFLAAWVAHWDSRGPNTFDAFVRTTEDGPGHVVHYFLDFGESLAGISMRGGSADPRVGLETVGDVGATLTDMVTFGLLRRPWDAVAIDPRYPNLSYFDVDHFDPLGFAPQTPLVRWERAQRSDLAWMARRIARLEEGHVRAIVAHGRYGDPAEEERMVEVLLGRRRRILQTAFSWSSPLTDLEIEGDRVCALDLAYRSDDGWEPAVFTATAHEADRSSRDLPVRYGSGSMCVLLGPHFAPDGAADDAAERYDIVEIRRSRGGVSTVIRVHLYDLGPERGWALAGIERPS